MLAVTSFEAGIAAWTIRGALICLLLFFGIRIATPNLKETPLEIAQSLWLIGSLLALLHAISTMAFYHQFRHDLALQDTALQTEQLFGLKVGIGIWLNYLFVLVWLVDAFWLTGSSASYLVRWRTLNGGVYGFLGFIAFNGAIVFESGPVRWLGVLAILVLAVFWKTRRWPADNESF